MYFNRKILMVSPNQSEYNGSSAFWTFDDVFITCGLIPGPCIANYFITDDGTIDSDISSAGQNCNFSPS